MKHCQFCETALPVGPFFRRGERKMIYCSWQCVQDQKAESRETALSKMRRRAKDILLMDPNAHHLQIARAIMSEFRRPLPNCYSSVRKWKQIIAAGGTPL